MAAIGDGERRKVVAIVGGNADRHRDRVNGPDEYRYFSSSKHGGRGELCSLVASIKAGGIDEVWILYRWIGHKESGLIERECAKAGIRAIKIAGLGNLPA